MVLTTEDIKKAKPGINARGKSTDKAYKLGDAGGLFLLVQLDGSKYWRWKYRFAGKENQLSFGKYPDISLIEARKQRDMYKKLLAEGINPSVYSKEARAKQIAEETRQLTETKFSLDNYGALSFRFGNKLLSLSASETTELRTFLDATKDVTPREEPCP